MRIHYTFDDSPARLPLAIRSVDGVWDRASELRSSPGVHLVELTTQHMLNTGTMLTEELASYFENTAPSESDPYALAECYANRDALTDLLRDLRDLQPGLAAFEEVEMLFPVNFLREMNFTLALTTVGFPAFGYVRTYKDSEGEEFHGMVVNLTQARPHLERRLGQFSLSLLADTVRYGFFNHEGFQLAYGEYCQEIDRVPEKPADRLKDTLLARGIAWYLSYRHDLPFYDAALGLNEEVLAQATERWNAALDTARKKGTVEDVFEDWLHRREAHNPEEIYQDIVGYYAARAIANRHGNKGLRDSILQGPDHFIALYNGLTSHPLRN